MRSGFLYAFGLILVPQGAQMVSAEDRPPSPQEFVDRVLASRRPLSSGTATVGVVTLEDVANPGYKDIKYQIEMTFSGPSMKSIVKWIYPDRTDVYKLIRTGDKFIEAVPGGMPALVTNPATHKQSMGLFHFELLGFYPHTCLSLGQFNLSDLFHKHVWEVNSVLQDKEYHGCYRYDRSRKPNKDVEIHFAVWADPQQNYAVRKITAYLAKGQVKLAGPEETAVVESKRYGDTNTWYPARVHYTKTNGGRLIVDEIATVESLQLGEVNADSFSIQSLDIEMNRKVHTADPKGGLREQFWNGKAVSDLPVVGDELQRVESSKSRLVVAFAATGAALLILWVAIRLGRSRASDTPSDGVNPTAK